jgi:hypothetical protein
VRVGETQAEEQEKMGSFNDNMVWWLRGGGLRRHVVADK